MTYKKFKAVAFGLCIAAGAYNSAAAAGSGETLAAVKERGTLRCGVIGHSAGFSLPDSKGIMRGIDADVCRIVAAAVLGDSTKVEYISLTAAQRLPALQSGEADLVAANLTWTLSREAVSGVSFAAIEYYDGVGFMVPKKLGVKSATELDGASVCMIAGNAEGTAHDFFNRYSMKYNAVVFGDGQELRSAFLNERCDVYMTDMSALVSFRASLGDKAADFDLLPELASKEPLGMAVLKGDGKWFDVVRWGFYSTVEAEELDVDSTNVDEMLKSDSPRVKRLLGVSGDLGQALGLDNAWAYNIIKQVGNYKEIWERSFGVTGVPRAYNKLWFNGGLMYAPAMR